MLPHQSMNQGDTPAAFFAVAGARPKHRLTRSRPMAQYSFTEKKRIRKSFAKRASVLPVPFLLETQLNSYRAFLQELTADGSAQERRPAGRVHLDLPDFQPLGQRQAGIRRLFAAAAGLRRHRMPAARSDLLLGAARQGPADPDGQGSAEGDRQGSQGAGSLHGRNPADDEQRLVRHQRHRARDRFAAAPLARRVLRARSRQDAQLGQAACFRRA